MNADWVECDTAVSHFIPSSDEEGLNLHLRAKGDTGTPVLMVHGAGLASRSFDIPKSGASWMDKAVEDGFTAYALDIRGYGLSRSNMMAQANLPYARATDAIKDIDDAVNWISRRHDGAKPSVIGMSWGSVTTGIYAATIGADKIASLCLAAPIFAERNQGWIDMLADPSDPTRINPDFGSFRRTPQDQIRIKWDEEIPQNADWRDEGTFDAMMAAIMSDDRESGQFDPPQFRAPNGTFVDLWHCFNGQPLYDPGAIKVPVLLTRGAQDTTSTRSDTLQLFDRLGAEDKQYAEIANGSHFLIAERKAPQLCALVNGFFASVG